MSNLILPIRPEGPIVRIALNVSKPKQDALTNAGTALPAWVTVDFLVDTGASMTSIDQSIPVALGLTHHSLTPMRTPSTGATPVQCKTYDVALYILPPVSGGVGHLEEALAVVESDWSAHSIKGLLGRDVLSKCILTYTGLASYYTLSF